MNPQSTAIPGPMHTKQTFNTKRHNFEPKSVVEQSRTAPFWFQKLYQFGPKFWDRSDGPSRPHSTQTFVKHLKGSKNSSREKILPLGVCQNFSNPGSTRSLLCVERFPFLLRRNPTVRLPGILERWKTFSLLNPILLSTASPSPTFTFLAWLNGEDESCSLFRLLVT